MNDSIKIKIGTVITFTQTDILFFDEMADRKISAKLKSNLSISNYGTSMTSKEKEAMSIASETAFCRMCGLPDPDEVSIINNRYFDFKIFGKTIDVKATASAGLWLSVSIGRLYKNYADIFVLIRRQKIKEYVFNGAVFKENVIDEKNIKQPQGFKTPVYLSTKFEDLELP